MGHAQVGSGTHAEGTHPRGQGIDPAAPSRHPPMEEAIADGQVLLAREMGAGASGDHTEQLHRWRKGIRIQGARIARGLRAS
jgi:hypothetical protein